MNVEKEQFDKVMAELRRACLPAGGADAVQAYVDAQGLVLAQVMEELNTARGDLAGYKMGAKAEADAGDEARAQVRVLKAQLVEAVALLRRARGPARVRAVDEDIDAFLACHGENYGPTAKGARTLRTLLQEHAPELAALVEPYKGMTLREGLEAAAQSEQEPAPTTTALGQALDAIAAMPRRQPVIEQAEQQEECTHEFVMFQPACVKCGEPYQAEQQEAQGAQAVDGLDAVAEAIFNADKGNWYSAGPYSHLHANDKARLRAMARAALATQPAVRGSEPTEEVWQSMETAPKDRRILVLRTVNPATGRREAFIARWNAQPHHSKPQPYWEVEAAGASVRQQREQPPLGWMPLPQTAAVRGADHA